MGDRGTLRRILCALALGVLAAGPALGKDDERGYRLAFVGPLSGPLAAAGEEAVFGLTTAAEVRNAAGGVSGRKVAIQKFDDRDDPLGIDKALAAAFAAKCDAVVAMPTGRTIAALEAKYAAAKKSKAPTILVGGVGPRLTLERDHPLFFLGPWPVEHAIQVAIALQAPCASVVPGLVVEDTPRGRELEAAIRRNVGPRQTVCGTVWVAAGAAPAPEALAKLRDLRCDRLVVVGEPDLLDATAAAARGLSWKVPFLGAEGTLSKASSVASGATPADVYFVVGAPTRTAGAPPRAILDAIDRTPAAGSAPYPRSVAAYTAAEMLFASSEGLKPPKDAEVVAALRGQRYGDDESKTTFFDQVGRASLYKWRPWRVGAKGPEPFDPALVPIDGFGTLIRMRTPAFFDAQPGTKVVWATFGDEKSSQKRSIEKDLARLHLGTRGYEGDLDALLKDELMARALGKLNRLFLKNEDGTGVPGVSFAISFTDKKPANLKPHDYWTAVIAGDDADAGGRAWPGEGRCEIYSTFLLRTIFEPNALDPPMGQEDKKFLDGTYVAAPYPLQHLRADRIRCLVDGFAGSFALTGAHELGHLAGLDHDVSDPRSIMNVAEGVGLRETQAVFIPAHSAALEKLLGRWPEEKERDRRR
jgi:ABC-type branched-subunit amino acid transport system substrate-binding protein